VLGDVRERCFRWLRREGLADPDGEGPMADPSACGPLEGLAQAATQRGAIESLAPEGEVEPDAAADLAFAPRPGGRWSAAADGWNLHAGVCIPAGDFEGRERLVRYAARPSFALGRLRELPDGRLAYRVRWARSASGPYRIMTPLELLTRLAAIVPPPRYPLSTYHGVLAPASRWRAQVVPRPRDVPAGCAHGVVGRQVATAEEVPRPPVPRDAVRAVGLLVPLPEPEEQEYSAVIPVERWKQLADGALLARAPKIDWPTLLRRSFAEDVLACPKCRGRLQVLDVVAKPDEARRLLEQLGLDGNGGHVTEPTKRESGAARVVRDGDVRRPRSPPARAGPAAGGACIRSTSYPTPRG